MAKGRRLDLLPPVRATLGLQGLPRTPPNTVSLNMSPQSKIPTPQTPQRIIRNKKYIYFLKE